MRVLIKKINSTNTLLSTEVLIENEDVQYSIVEDAPIIEEKEGMIGHYELEEEGKLVVKYEPKPKSEIEIINEKLDAILGNTAQSVEDGLVNMDMLISNDEKLTEIDNKLTPNP